ncbi:MAG: hypothetical protein ACD_34C00566G0001 [uncultured bacterium]|nr:MAG: hypothetical protein ACD_34C00566G0001 [uncultured bacterium]
MVNDSSLNILSSVIINFSLDSALNNFKLASLTFNISIDLTVDSTNSGCFSIYSAKSTTPSRLNSSSLSYKPRRFSSQIETDTESKIERYRFSLSLVNCSLFFISSISRVIDNMQGTPSTSITLADINPTRDFPSLYLNSASRFLYSPLASKPLTSFSRSSRCTQRSISKEDFPIISSLVNPVSSVKPRLMSMNLPVFNSLILIASGEVKKAFVNLSSRF